jgi:NAD(P)-dependent dehydrogenase (short-subunit alcohol dehydrogenase family)
MTLLDRKIVLVVGASAGIGRAIASGCGAEGATVVLAARREELGLAAVREIEAAGGKAWFMAIDITQDDELARLFEMIKAKYGRLDGAVNNAAAQIPARPIADTPIEDFDQLYRINLRATALCLHYELKIMRDQRSGSVVNISSVGGLRGLPNIAPYIATKHAVVGLTKVGALEMAKLGVRVNCICPGTVKTEMLDLWLDSAPEYKDKLVGGIPLARLGRGDEIANMAVWLLSDKASYVTGQSMVADGGVLEAFPY